MRTSNDFHARDAVRYFGHFFQSNSKLIKRESIEKKKIEKKIPILAIIGSVYPFLSTNESYREAYYGNVTY